MKKKHVFEKFCSGEAFPVFSDEPEPVVKPAENLDAVHIRHE